jgi:uncharacterized membrane protein
MGMALLYVGLALWIVPHLFKRVAPASRAKMGDPVKLVVTVASFAALVLMVVGYRMADVTPVYAPARWLLHLNNLVMLVALYVFGIGMAKGALSQMIRHPMLLGVTLWSVAHLMVRGDLASLVLFGGMGAWAVVSMLSINARTPTWVAPKAKGGAKRDLVAAAIVLVVYAIVGTVHGLIGPNPFGGM